MPNPALHKILNKIKGKDFATAAASLPLSELNSLLLDIFNEKARTRKPSFLVDSFRDNRFVFPSAIAPADFMRLELPLLELAERGGFQTLELSPLAPLGVCAAIALADQNKIVSALRGTEVVSDATNVLAVLSALQRAQATNDVHLCATHRHVRAQAFNGKGFTAHFKIFCAVSAGRDTGGNRFEINALQRHLDLYFRFFTSIDTTLFVTLKILDGGDVENVAGGKIASAVSEHFASAGFNVGVSHVPVSEHRYYHTLRFSLDIPLKDGRINIGDGGFVDWGQRLSSNGKERMLTSGVGTELLLKILKGML